MILFFFLIFPFTRSSRHVLHIENLIHIIGKDEWFVSVCKIIEIHYCHSVQLVYRYPTSCHLDPFASKQWDLEIRTIVKFPYVLYVTIICVLFPILVSCIKSDTTVLVGALLILGVRVKYIPIDLVPLESQYS